MIKKMNVLVPSGYLQEARLSIPQMDSKLTLNEPTGDFFYKPWTIKPEYKDTVWDRLIKTLPIQVGEARLIKLDIERCYTVHADIDNRWHYTLHSDNSYLIDADSKTMHSLVPGEWYHMDAGRSHSAANLDCDPRVSLVVRELLPNCELEDPKGVWIIIDTSQYNYRFNFDKHYSKLLNYCQINKLLSNFYVDDNTVLFQVDRSIEIPRHPGFKVIEDD